jgi:hypothetical protein
VLDWKNKDAAVPDIEKAVSRFNFVRRCGRDQTIGFRSLTTARIQKGKRENLPRLSSVPSAIRMQQRVATK